VAHDDSLEFGLRGETRSIFGRAARRVNFRRIDDQQPQSLAAERHCVAVDDANRAWWRYDRMVMG
jgi:hypothetical protein